MSSQNQDPGPPPAESQPPGKDFQALRASGEKAGASKAIGLGFVLSRDALARVLIRCGFTPNHLTLLGLAITCGAAYCLAHGASHQVPYFVFGDGPVSWWPTWAAILIVLSGACDMLDGAVARVGHMGTKAGAVLDSTVDRLSDVVIYLGCLVHFGRLESTSLTYQVLATVALSNAVLISYIKARAEDLIQDCGVGYWLRGERVAAMLIGCSCGHVPAVLWQMAVSCAFTVWRRATYAYSAVRALELGRTPPPRGPNPGWIGRVQLWRHPRGSVPYDFVTGAHIAYIIFAPCIWPALLAAGVYADPLRQWLTI